MAQRWLLGFGGIALWMALCGCLHSALEGHLARSYTKRAYKTAYRKYFNDIFRDLWFVPRGVWGWLTLRWQRSLMAESDSLAHRLLICNRVLLWSTLCYTLTLLLSVWESACILVPMVMGLLGSIALLVLAMLAHHLSRRPLRGGASAQGQQKISVPAYLLRYGYLIAALLCVVPEHPLGFAIAGMLLCVNGMHLLLERHFHTDTFYCYVQNLEHHPMTSGHHSASYRNYAEKQGRGDVAVLLVMGIGTLLGGVLLWMI